MRLSLAIIFLVIVLILLTLEENEASRKRRSSPSRSRSPSRKTPSRKKKPTTTYTKKKKPKVVKPKIYKNTRMPVKVYNSPVIVQQTRYLGKSSKYPKYLAAGMAGGLTVYALSRAPVYRGYYPMYGSHVHMPRNTGIRVLEERQEIVNRYTMESCYQLQTKRIDGNTPIPEEPQAPINETTKEELDNPIDSKTTITYDGDEQNKTTGTKNVSLNEDKINKNFTAVTITDYEGDIAGTKITGNCTRVITTTRASMIRVHESNPYANAAFVEPTSSSVLIFTLVFVCAKFLR